MTESIIKRGLRIGDLDAETDWNLAKNCFVDNGDIELLVDVNRPESIVLGRTGAGKTAVLLALTEKVEKSILLDPNDVSIRYLEHSDIIQFFDKLGVNLDLFYKLLWKHILTVEFLKLRYKLENENESNAVWQKLKDLVSRNPIKQEALEYFKEWGNKFWLDTDQQLKEVTEKLARDITAKLGGGLLGVDMSAQGAESLSEERKIEIVHKANKVVSSIQITKLSRIIKLLEEDVFDDRQKCYYLLLDKLDEDWADTNTRYKFIRALIEEIKNFRKISNVKIIIALRKDLLDSVFDHTRDAGFQQEKYESYILPITWTKAALESLISKRINEVYKRQYTKQGVIFTDIFPIKAMNKKGGQTALNYILERTLYRPRDVLQFINECFVAAFNSPRISWRAIKAAEANYSEKRLKSLYEEWSEIYPGLCESIEILRHMPYVFKRSNIAEKINNPPNSLFEYTNDPCCKALLNYCGDNQKKVSESDVIAEFVNCFYKIGAIGVKMSTTEPYMWADYDHAVLSRSEIKRVNQVKIHKMLGRALGVKKPVEGAIL